MGAKSPVYQSSSVTDLRAQRSAKIDAATQKNRGQFSLELFIQ